MRRLPNETRAVLALASVLPLATGAVRAESVPVEGDGLRLELGVEVREAGSEYAIGRRTGAFPLIHLADERGYWRTTSIGHYLAGASAADRYWAVAVELSLPPDGIDVDHAPLLVGLADREPTLEGGFRFSGGGRWGTADIGMGADLEGEHGGVRAALRYEWPIRLDRLVIAPALFATWRDRRNADHYYGVDEDEAGAGRPAYEVSESSVDIGVGYSVTYALGAALSVFHAFETRTLDDPIDASPLTANGSPFAVSAGVLYRVL